MCVTCVCGVCLCVFMCMSGVLDAGEIKETLKRLGLKVSDDQIKVLLNK